MILPAVHVTLSGPFAMGLRFWSQFLVAPISAIGLLTLYYALRDERPRAGAVLRAACVAIVIAVAFTARGYAFDSTYCTDPQYVGTFLWYWAGCWMF